MSEAAEAAAFCAIGRAQLALMVVVAAKAMNAHSVESITSCDEKQAAPCNADDPVTSDKVRQSPAPVTVSKILRIMLSHCHTHIAAQVSRDGMAGCQHRLNWQRCCNVCRSARFMKSSQQILQPHHPI